MSWFAKRSMGWAAAATALLLVSACTGGSGPDPADPSGTVTEFALAYPAPASAAAHPQLSTPHGDGVPHDGSTHEITWDEKRDGDMWVTGQMHDSLVRLTSAGQARFIPMTARSGPHGIVFDSAGRLWVTLEFAGTILMLDKDGRKLAEHSVAIDCPKCPQPNNPQPHGLGVGPDGRTIWFTGKTAGVVGRIDPDGKVTTFPLSSPDSLPIYIKAGPDGNMWVTMLAASKIARVTPEGVVTEFVIPTENSRPIAIVPGPDGAMWFSEEAGSKVARIGMDGRITEFAIPRSDPRLILAGLAFDSEGNLWTQQYMPHKTPDPNVADSIVRIDRKVLQGGQTGNGITFNPVSTRDTVMHRIVRGPDGNMWFTEMNADKVGRLHIAR
ncbi:MAG TPA: hypothetical protein VIT45_08935 [Allosphingosinicella sp.]